MNSACSLLPNLTDSSLFAQSQQLAPQETMKNISQQIDTRSLQAFLVSTHQWTEQQAKRAIQQYFKFLCLVWLYPDRPLIPTQQIDCVWHCHILHTHQYRQDCEALFGYYLDHLPESGLDNHLEQSLQAAFEHTKDLFERHFGIGSFDAAFDQDGNGDRPTTSIILKQQLQVKSSDPSACGRPARQYVSQTV